MIRFSTLIVIICTTTLLLGQQPVMWHDPTYAGGTHIWVKYDNDFFTSTDRFYSQGISGAAKFEVRSGWLSRTIFSLPNSVKTVGFGAHHMAYTPKNIERGFVGTYDHPYSAQFQAFAIFETVDTAKGNMFGYRIGGGIIGPEAHGEAMQIAIHNTLGGVRPIGWNNQIQEGLLVSGAVFGRQRLFGLREWFATYAEEQINVGSGYNDLIVGARFQTNFTSRTDKWVLGLYFSPGLRAVGYDPSLQGSLINSKDSPITLAARDINRLIFQREIGAVARAGSFTISYMLHIDSPHFRQQLPMRWGAIRIGWNF